MNFVQNEEAQPRFPGTNGQPMPVEDRSTECSKWAFNGGCKLDKDFQTSKFNPTPQSVVSSFIMFDFMQKTCLKSCGWAEKGKMRLKNL